MGCGLLCFFVFFTVSFFVDSITALESNWMPEMVWMI